VKTLICYRINDDAPAIVPARSERAWMDATRQRFAYRCLPLTIANSMGWEILCPMTITAEWNGGPDLADIVVSGDEPQTVERYAHSHFGHGVLTFQTHYLFRTEPAIALWVRGSPNLPKDGIAPLDGIVETDWLNFTFTMNWIFTRPGRVTFEKDEAFCFVTPVAYRALDDLVPEIRPMASEPELAAAYTAYGKLRGEFNEKLAQDDPQTVARRWQKWYMRGEHHTGEPGNRLHISKLSLAAPDVRAAKAQVAARPAKKRRSGPAGKRSRSPRKPG
jgi:hypothetical protein